MWLQTISSHKYLETQNLNLQDGLNKSLFAWKVRQKADMADRINVLNIPKLFMDDLPHSSYVCQDYEKDGARCGVNFQY